MAIQYPQDNRVQMIVQEIVRRTNDHGRRLRDVEDKIRTIEDRLNSMEENFIEKAKKSNERFTDIEASRKDISDTLLKLDNNMEKINKQIINFARKRDIKELERMFELLNPIRQEFITRDEVERIKKETE
jgi:predicted  nucleic acid-binding Zn-ribbon protein